MKTNGKNNSLIERLSGFLPEDQLILAERALTIATSVHGEKIYHPVEVVNAYLDLNCQIKNSEICALLLHDVCEKSDFFGSLADYKKFTVEAKRLIAEIFGFGEETADWVIRLTKPKIDLQAFDSKQERLNFYIKNLEGSDTAMFLKMIDRFHKLTCNLKAEKIRWQETPGTLSDEAERVIRKTEKTYLPLFEDFVTKLKETQPETQLYACSYKLLAKIRQEFAELTAGLKD